MLLIVGLGNPEKKYEGNRHNVGFMIADAIAERYGFSPERQKFNALARDGVLDSNGARGKALILKPQTYYNDSGRAVRAAVDFYKIALEDVVVFHDELDLAPGKLRMKQGGGTAGNNGLKSITAHIGNDFRRARVGIGHPGSKDAVTPYVLSDFAKAEHAEWLEDLIRGCADAAPLLCAGEDADAKFMSRVALFTNPPQREKTGEKTDKKQAATARGSEEPAAASAAKTEKTGSPFDKLKGLFGSE